MLETTLFKHRRRVLEGLKKSEGVNRSILRASELDYEGCKPAADLPRGDPRRFWGTKKEGLGGVV